MVRRARTVIPKVAHHITQRGNNRQDVFLDDDDRRKYLEILETTSRQFGLRIHGYCLMTNHVHIIAEPENEEALSLGIGRANLRYSIAVNQRTGKSGRLWHNRFYSCPLDDTHYLAAMRYIERNPVRAKITRTAWQWPWSSAAAHTGKISLPQSILSYRHWQKLGIAPHDWRMELMHVEDDAVIDALRHATNTGWPLGSDKFIDKMEKSLDRRLRPLPIGRQRKVK